MENDADSIHCPYCDANLRPSFKHCPDCGKPMSEYLALYKAVMKLALDAGANVPEKQPPEADPGPEAASGESIGRARPIVFSTFALLFLTYLFGYGGGESIGVMAVRLAYAGTAICYLLAGMQRGIVHRRLGVPPSDASLAFDCLLLTLAGIAATQGLHVFLGDATFLPRNRAETLELVNLSAGICFFYFFGAKIARVADSSLKGRRIPLGDWLRMIGPGIVALGTVLAKFINV